MKASELKIDGLYIVDKTKTIIKLIGVNHDDYVFQIILSGSERGGPMGRVFSTGSVDVDYWINSLKEI